MTIMFDVDFNTALFYSAMICESLQEVCAII